MFLKLCRNIMGLLKMYILGFKRARNIFDKITAFGLSHFGQLFFIKGVEFVLSTPLKVFKLFSLVRGIMKICMWFLDQGKIFLWNYGHLNVVIFCSSPNYRI